MIKHNLKVSFIIVFALLILTLPPLTFAASEDDNVPIPSTDPPSTVPLTPEGNLSLLDDLVVETNADFFKGKRAKYCPNSLLICIFIWWSINHIATGVS